MSADHPRPIGPWLPQRKQGPVRKITVEELEASVVYQDERVLAINKAGDFVCHPSKDGPWSSLVGACREWLQLPAVHLVFRLDRETSGVVVFAKDALSARKLQIAAQEHRYHKRYIAILRGEMEGLRRVDLPLGDDYESPVAAKVRAVPQGCGQAAVTTFHPLVAKNGFTITRVVTETGRKHQIRAHAECIGYPLVGDKIYGGDPSLFLEFIEHGWTARLSERLLMPRQALHCGYVDLRPAGENHVFEAPLPQDLQEFCRTMVGYDPAEIVLRPQTASTAVSIEMHWAAMRTSRGRALGDSVV
jgi:23S rRNA pseudouridine1911/1915/1917 synthase